MSNTAKPLHIAFYHDAIIPPLKYGGTERIIAWLIRELNQRGHRTTLIAKPGSTIEGTNCITIAKHQDWRGVLPHDVDVLHLWSTPSFVPKIPYLVTIEGNGQPGEKFHANTVFVSKKHAENHSSRHFVYNGLDPSEFTVHIKRERHLVFLAKASWSVKNLMGAIAVAKKADLPLEVLGSRSWPLELQRRMPRMAGLRYHGMVDDVYKRQILASARALLFPVRWHEPFGIAITEALASGCPVLGTPYGSLPEIVSPDVGVLSNQGSVLAQAALECDKFTPEQCRARITKGFSSSQMTDEYLLLYRKLLTDGRLGAAGEPAPCTKPGFASEELLDWTNP